ncbi:MAG: putative lipid II flippase FtsW [Pontiellaceae bacterium]|nr:putative lipid II flippase FtsW [Pontiellaceae bacterium]MBN2785204.1 putative lipid II flippase FtsW [Pontiellaceae bacterium]
MRRAISLFIAVVLILVTLGILILASASSTKYENASYYSMRQLIWLALSFCAAVIAARLDYRIYQRLAIPLAAVTLILLLIVRAFCPEINGSHRWISVAGFTFQPSELAKISVILLFAWWLSRNQRRINEFVRGILIPFGMLGCFVVLIIIEPDFGTTLLVSCVAVCMMFLGGSGIAPLLVIGVSGLTGVAWMIAMNHERMGRIMAFLDPQKYEQDEAWQLVNALRAFASGGQNGWFRGQGYGNSMQKYHYLPEAHTDFIFPILGEELGLMAGLIVIMLYLTLFILGLAIAFKAKDDFGRFVAFGITLMITIQALINFAVVTGCVPTKGLALPFISYGGSSLLVSGAMIGVLVNIAHSGMGGRSHSFGSLFKDRARKI